MNRLSQIPVNITKRYINIGVKRCITTGSSLSMPQTKSNQDVIDNRPNLSFMANLFRGQIQSAEIFPYPLALSDEQKETVGMLSEPFGKFLNEVNNPAKNDENEEVDEKVVDGLWELGAFGVFVPAEYGGLELTNSQYLGLADLVGANDLGMGIMVGAHQSIGYKGILLYGSKEQKEKYLPMVTTGKYYAAFCLTEPSSGSDAGSIKSRAVKTEDGKHYVLNGSKIWITNGGIAEIMTVFAQTEVVDPKTNEKKDKVTAFIVERSFGGVTHSPPESKMGIKCSNTASIYYENVKIPVENVIGGEGNGFKVAMNILNNGRFGMAGTLSGTMRTCIKIATEHATNRVQFGKKINQFGSIQEKLARMTMYHYATSSMAYMIAGNMDKGSQDYHLEAAISKVFASEAAWYVCDEAIQILGGMGFMKGTGLERIMRDLRIFRIFEGTNDILRLFVALTGIQYAGAHLKELQKAFKNPTANLGLIFKESTKRAKRSVGISDLDMTNLVDNSLADSAHLTTQCIDLFGATVESLLIKYNKQIVDQQFLLNLLANAAIDIYAMTAVLSRATYSIDKKLPSAEHEKLIAINWCIKGSTRAKENLAKIGSSKFDQLFRNTKTIAKDVCIENGIVVQSLCSV